MTDTARILIVDDDPRMRHMLVKVLGEHGYDAQAAGGGAEALELLHERPFDIVLSDVRMPELDGLELLRRVRAEHADTSVVMMTAFGTVDSAVAAMREGAYDYVSKPFKMDEILIVLGRVVEEKRLRRELVSMRRAMQDRFGLDNLVGRSKAMTQVYELIRRVAPVASTVLIQGASGTGKELVARAIHHNGPRRQNPFVPVNCSALPEDLLESELFGHVKGAFTGATAGRPGLFLEADGGTLFLDEIGEMSLDLQSKLLRVLQDRNVRPVGGSRETRVDVRVIAATHQDLAQRIREKTFREDLFFRLNVIPIRLPELRERPEDIPVLAEHFLDKHRLPGEPPKRVSRAAMAALMRYSWPGNVRELENAMERASVLCRGDVIEVEDLPEEMHGQAGDVLAEAVQEEVTLQELERRYIERVLARTGGHQSRAAQILGIDRRTLYRKLHERRDSEHRRQDARSSPSTTEPDAA